MLRRSALVCVLAGLIAIPAYGQIINNNDISRVSSLPQSVMNSIGKQRWLFTHASVGGNMVDGMNSLHSSNPTRYKLVTSDAWFNSSSNRVTAPPSPTLQGRIYECQRGNPGWEQKGIIFDNSVRLGGWHASAVDLCLDKLCYIDQDANANTYTTKMSALEALYPDTIFVYATMPLTTETGGDNILRNKYNQAVRSYCIANHKLLYDIADLEAHNPSGVESTFPSGGNTYQRLYSGYTDDGGHLNSAGQQHVALGWYAVAAAVVPYGANNRAVSDALMETASTNSWFTIWGKVSEKTADSFTLNDGANKSIRVIAKGCSGFINGDTVRATGLIDRSTTPPTMYSTSARVKKGN